MSEGKDVHPGYGGEAWADVVIRFALGALIIYWSFLLLRPFFEILIWAAILTVSLNPFHLRLRRLLGGRTTLASLLVTLFALVAILGPISIISVALVNNLTSLAAGIAEGTIKVPPPPPFVAEIPLIGERLTTFWQTASVELVELLESLAPQLATAARTLLTIVGNVGVGVLQFTLAIIIAGFTFSQATVIRETVTKIATRAAPEQGEGFVDLARGTVRSVARGVIGLSLIQSILFGIGALVAGIPLAGLWSFVVLICAIVQVGPTVVILPIIIYAWISMDASSATLFTAYMVPVMLLDNIFKPIVMGRGLPVPMLVIFIGVVGGTISHGLIGLFLGPIVLSLGYELGRAWVTMPPNRRTPDRPSTP